MIERICADKGIGQRNVYAALYGTQEQVAVNWKIVTDAIKALGKGAIITEEEAGDTEPFKYRAKLIAGNSQSAGVWIIQLAWRRWIHVVCASQSGPWQRNQQTDAACQENTE